MPQISIIGLDIAKNIFQLHGVTKSSEVLLRKRLRRAQMIPFFQTLSPCLIGIESCAGSHYWARTLTDMGHKVRLMDPRFVKPYVKGNKTDANDAEAICEAVQRPNMRFVPIKSREQQSVLHWHRSRSQYMQQRIALGNHIRSLLLELGITIARGVQALHREIPSLIMQEQILHSLERTHLEELWSSYLLLQKKITQLEKQIANQVKEDRNASLLMSIPGIGILSASALVATIGDGSNFKNGRQLSAYLGLVPKQYSSGGKTQMLGISKRGNTSLRTLLIHGSRAVYLHHHKKETKEAQWLGKLAQRRHHNVAVVAQANKLARYAWAVLNRGTPWVEGATA